MTDSSIKCPKCGAEITLTEALTGPFRETLRAELEADVKAREAEALQREKALAAKEAQLVKQKAEIAKEIADKVEAERKKLGAEESVKAQRAVKLDMEDLQGQLKEKDEKLAEAKKKELALLKQERELKERQESFELELNRQLSADREKIRKEAADAVAEQHKHETADLKFQNKTLREQIDILKQKAEQGSQQTQGEILEIELEQLLGETFPEDNIRPVPKGVSGADVLQEICMNGGSTCGTIIWEAKRTKNWSDNWIEKLKVDQRKVKAEIAVILSIALPKGCGTFVCLEGVWVTNFKCAMGLAFALRQSVMQVASVRAANMGKGKKMELLYAYLSGNEFKDRVESMVEAFMALKKELDQEKRAVMKLWAQREKQLEKVVINLSGMYGELQGIAGASMPQIRHLELKALPGSEK
jgi:hypothetical protein